MGRYTQSFTVLRQFCEKWQWIDPCSNQLVTGYIQPQTARKVERKPCYIKFLTETGHVDEGECVCLKVDVLRHQRMVQFVKSKEIRIVNDILVIEVDGIRFITH